MAEYGWWEGKVNGKRGMFPSNFVEAHTGTSEISIQNKIVLAKVIRSHSPQDEVKAQVLYDYDAEEPDELTIKAGDTITNISMVDGGWWEGVVNGKRGTFPSSFVEIYTGSPEQSSQNKKVLAKVTANYTPESDRELSLVEGDIIEITSQQDAFWWEGVVNGKQGHFPSYCVVPIPEGGQQRKQQDYATPDDQREAILSAETTVSNDGGVLQIAGTDVKLIIPPDALGANKTMCLIQMRIISSGSHDVAPTSFSCNSSVIVELLPNNLRFRKPVKLTLPHCLQLKKDVEYKVRIFMSHHDGNAEPRWEEVADPHYTLHDRACTFWLNIFCWTKYEIDDEVVEAKRIKVFTAAKPICVPDDIAEIEVGYHLDLPGAGEILQLNPSLIVGQRRPYLFLREGKHPLQVSLHKILSPTWKYSSPEENPKEIPFRSVASSIAYSCPFILQQDTKSCDIPTCVFKASQNQNDIELLIRPKAVQTMAGSTSAAEVHFQENVTHPVKETTNQSEQYLGMQQPNPEISSLQALHSPSSAPEINKEPLVFPATKGEEIRVAKSKTTADQNLGPRLRPSQTQLKRQVEEHHHHQLLQYRGQQPGANNLSIQHYDYSQHMHMVPIPFSTFEGLYGPHEPPWYGESEEAGGPGINYGILLKIAKKLDPPDPLDNDWKMLAGELGFTIEDITLFERFKSPTCKVITCAFQRSQLESLEQLKSILTRIQRADAAKCIPD